MKRVSTIPGVIFIKQNLPEPKIPEDLVGLPGWDGTETTKYEKDMTSSQAEESECISSLELTSTNLGARKKSASEKWDVNRQYPQKKEIENNFSVVDIEVHRHDTRIITEQNQDFKHEPKLRNKYSLFEIDIYEPEKVKSNYENKNDNFSGLSSGDLGQIETINQSDQTIERNSRMTMSKFKGQEEIKGNFELNLNLEKDTFVVEISDSKYDGPNGHYKLQKDSKTITKKERGKTNNDGSTFKFLNESIIKTKCCGLSEVNI